MERKILVFGANGQVGREIVRRAGDAATGFDRVIDISDAVAVRQAVLKHPPSAIVNAAGYTAVDQAETDIDRGGDILNWHGFAKLIFEQAARYGQTVPRLVPIESVAFPSKATRAAYSVLSTEKIARMFAIRPRPLRDSLNECLAEMLTQRH